MLGNYEWVGQETGYADYYGLDSLYEWRADAWNAMTRHEVPWYQGGALYVKADGKKAWGDALSCDPATHDVRRGAVTSAANFAQTTFNGGHSYEPLHEVILYMPDGFQQTFQKTSASGSMQYERVPGSAGECKKPTT